MQLYKSRIEQLVIKHDGRVHTPRSKQILLAHFPNMCEEHQGLVNLTETLFPWRLLPKLRDATSEMPSCTTGFLQVANRIPCHPCYLFMILEGTSIKHESESTTAPASFPSTSALCTDGPPQTLCLTQNATIQETPVPTYIGLMLHAHTRTELVDRLTHMGILSTMIGSCPFSHRCGTVSATSTTRSK